MIRTVKYSVFAIGIAFSGYSMADSINKQGNTMIDLNKKKTWCIGRYSVEVPAEAILKEQRDNYDAFKIKTVSQKATRQDFDNAVEKVKKEYTNRANRYVVKESKVLDSKGIVSKIIWVKLSKTAPITDIRAFVLDGNHLFAIEAGYSASFQEKASEGIDNLVKKLKKRGDNEVPKEKGFCIKNGFIQDDGKKYRFTTQSMNLKFPQHPSINMILESESVSEDDGGLINRMTSNLKEQGLIGKVLTANKTIRKGKKQVNQFAGEELATRIPMKGRNGTYAIWAYSGVAKNNNYPSIQLDLNSGNDLKTDTASLNDKEAEKLYEEILKSIKLF